MINFTNFYKAVPLPLEFINKYMINANATYVKVYLYGLGKCYESSEEEMTNASIADALDILETDVSRAWRYWKKAGLVHSEGKGNIVYDIIPSEKQENTQKSPKSEAEAPKKPSQEEAKAEVKASDTDEIPPVSMKEISQAMQIDPGMKETISLAEQLLKKPLSKREITAIYNFTDWYQMSQEMVLVLLEYCVSIEKTSFAYIEKVAKSWHDEGITTLESANKALNRLTKENRMMNKCKKIFGIERAFTQSEQNHIKEWVNEYQMSESMIKAAYERTINNIGKMSVPYINSILRSWHSSGIKTVSQIEEKEGKNKGTKSTSSYELDDMAAIERRRRLEKQKNG